METPFNLFGNKLYDDGNHSCFLVSWKSMAPFIKKMV
jgi:hypothetical protein